MNDLSAREIDWLIDVAGEGVALLHQWSQEIEFQGGSEDEMEAAIRYGVRADCGERAIAKLVSLREKVDQ